VVALKLKTTAEIFDDVCRKFNPRFERYRDRILYGTGEYKWFTEEDAESIEKVIIRTIEDFIAKERYGNGVPTRPAPARRQPWQSSESDSLDSFLGVSGRV
jgi:hypothetical protein